MTRFATVSVVVLAVTFALLAGSARANVIWIGGDSTWETAGNWLSDDTVPVNRLPISGEWAQVYNGGTARITATTGLVPASGSLEMIRVYGSASTIIQNGGTVNTGSMWVGASGDGIYRLEDGALNMGQLDISSLNQGNQLGHFIQTGGTANMSNIRFNYKGSNGQAYYELQDGDLILSGRFKMGDDLSSNATTWFTQTGGTVTIGQDVRMGTKAGLATGPGSAVINLDGGEMTIEAAAPFIFTQPGAPVFVDFDGGALNLLDGTPGAWDFARLTSIANSDFRAFGVAATAADLDFTPIMIGQDSYTQITNASTTVIPEPSSCVLAALGFVVLGLCGWRRRKRTT